PATPQAIAGDNLVTVDVPAVAVAEQSSDAPAVVPIIPPSTQAAQASATAVTAPPVVPEPIVTSEAIRTEPLKAETTPVITKSEPVALVAVPSNGASAKNLKSIKTTSANGNVEVTLAGDGQIAYKAFKL